MHSLDPTEDFALRLLRRFLLLCEHPRTQRRMLRMVRQSTRSGADTPKLYRWLNRVVLSPMAQRLGIPASTMKMELVASQLIGIAMLRYVVKVEPFASAPVEEVVALAAPALRAALSGSDGLSGAVIRAPEVRVPARRGAGAVLRRVGRGRAPA